MASRVWATAGGTLTSRGPWPRVPPGGPPAVLWGRRRASSPSLSPSIVSRFFSLVGTRLLPSSGTLRFLGGRCWGPAPPAPAHAMCILGFGPSGRSTQAANQAGGGPLRGARRDAHMVALCITIAAFCIEIAALCLEILAFCIEIIKLLPVHHNCSVAHRNGGTGHRNCCIMHCTHPPDSLRPVRVGGKHLSLASAGAWGDTESRRR